METDPELSDDELTVLAIAAEGEYMAPIGRWKPAIERLTMLGFLRKMDSVNFVITPRGRKRAAEQEDAEVMAVLRLNNEMVRRKEAEDGAVQVQTVGQGDPTSRS